MSGGVNGIWGVMRVRQPVSEGWGAIEAGAGWGEGCNHLVNVKLRDLECDQAVCPVHVHQPLQFGVFVQL